eukprot:7496742-Alexandrium_andersonii.AAC.1
MGGISLRRPGEPANSAELPPRVRLNGVEGAPVDDVGSEVAGGAAGAEGAIGAAEAEDAIGSAAGFRS